PEYWKETVRKFSGKPENLYWELYTEIIKRGAEMIMGVFDSSGYKYGYISGQVDPRFDENAGEMVKQGVMLSKISPNIMIKLPGTKEGIEAIEALTSMGIPTNATLTFTLSQLT